MNNLLKFLMSFALILWGITALSQQRTVTGVVLDQNNDPLVGVTVVIEGTMIVSVTNNKGEFSISAQRGAVLLFTYIGYKSEKVTVTDRDVLMVIMAEDALNLEEAVVTALGITRSEKSLGYSVSKLSNEEFNQTVSSNWLDGMAGKVAGLTFNQPSSPSGSMRVTLRGESSLNPSNSEALFVVDGVPINSSLSGTGNNSAYAISGNDNPIDFGDGVSDFNPEDIESVTVLKGAAATALYGSRAANGAIIITTKSGKTEKGIGVTVRSSVTFQKPSYWPAFQSEYGMGSSTSVAQQQEYSFTTFTDPEGIRHTASSQYNSWGPRFEGQLFYQYPGVDSDGNYLTPYEATPWVARDWYKGFFETGINYQNSVVIQGNNGRGSSARLSFTNTDDKWITPNSGYGRQVVSISITSPINRFMKLSVRANYNHRKSDNTPQTGYGRGSVLYGLMWSSPGFDINFYRDYTSWVKRYPNEARNNLFYSAAESPYFTAYEQLNTMDRHRLYGTTDLSIDITPKINLLLRTGVDMNNDFRTSRKAYNSVGYAQGRYREQIITGMDFNSDFLLKYTDKLGSFGLQAMFGGNILYQKRNNSTTLANGLDIQGQYTLSNSLTQLMPTLSRSNKQINSLYGMIQASYKDYLFLDITGRNDWSSALKKGNNSYFYPSVSFSAVLTDMIELPRQFSLLKLRASWANVGNDTKAYAIQNSYATSSFPGGVTKPTSFSNPDIKPEMTESWEFGIDGRFFSNRIGFDVVYYHATSYNQIVDTPVDPSTGYQNIMFNAGKLINQGWEITLTGRPIRTKKTRWDISVNYTRNRNKVVELAEGVDAWVINTYGTAQVEARPGGSMNAIYGYGFERVPEGAFITLPDGSKQDISGGIMYDASTGYPRVASSERIYLGESLPKWRGGITNTLSWNGFKLSCSVDAAFGGKAFTYDHAVMVNRGNLKETLPGRYEGLIGDGYVYDAESGTYSRNTTVTQYIGEYYSALSGTNNTETNVFSTSFVKLREASIEYSFPRKWMEKTKILQGASISLFGRNLAMWTKWPIYEPEVASLDGTNINIGLQSGAYPMTRSYGVNLKLQF